MPSAPAPPGHLIHIGYPKAGSSFLRAWFADHPQLAYAPRAIAGFDGIDAVARGAAEPGSAIRYRVSSSESLVAPIATAGLSIAGQYEHERAPDFAARQVAACAELGALFPTAHVLLVTRGFRAMILSSYSEYARTGGVVDIEGFLRGGISDVRHHPWDYNHVVEIYRARFGERLTVVPYELLRDEPSAFTRALEERLGLTHHPPTHERVNPSLSGVELRWYPRLTRAVAALPVGERLSRSLRARYLRQARFNRFRVPIRALQRLRPAPPVTADLIGDDILEYLRGCAEVLRAEPLYRPYHADYLL